MVRDLKMTVAKNPITLPKSYVSTALCLKAQPIRPDLKYY